MREIYSSGAKWETTVGYSRAVRVHNVIEVSGTTAIREGKLVGEGSAALQTQCVLEIIQEAIESLGGALKDVVRTRIYVANIDEWQEIGKVHATFFKLIRPATSMIEVSRLIDSSLLVEIEATAIIHEI